MKNNWTKNPIKRVFVIFLSMVCIFIIAGIGFFYCVFSIPEPEGISLASWPNTFTDNFSIWMSNEGEALKVNEIGIQRLDKYGLWLQVLDENGQEVFSYKKPETYPKKYFASELLMLKTSNYNNDNTIFTNSFEDGGKTWNYLIGFPYAIGKTMLYYNGEVVPRLSPLLKTIALAGLGMFGVVFIIYGFWLTRQIGRIAVGIERVSNRTYSKYSNVGLFGNIYQALNKLNDEICRNDKLKEDMERARREWISNITHDLKTPLSPIKGYAELLADNAEIDGAIAREYGSIILKNTNYVEKLVNDLKLTYQLDLRVIPFRAEKVNIKRFLKELIIDIANNPSFSNRVIEFESDKEELFVNIDSSLLSRAIENLVINALIHNPIDTKVIVSIISESEKTLLISIQDNGVGISEKDKEELFTRYYRGTNTKEKTEGSGLGLAIAKQIVELHHGKIEVNSELGAGTVFLIRIPAN
ncbi:sensor histidine kinase [Ruminiclostridium josui]|nr:ATP-binding protein [Ruminiclostridium josui]